MQQQNTLKGERRSTKPTATSKRHGRSSSGDADTTRSRMNAARSYRQSTMTRDDEDGNQANRRSKKDNEAMSGQNRRSGSPLAKRRSPVGGGRSASNAKSRSPEGSSRRAKQVTSNNNRGRNTPKSPKGSSAKTARSRR